MLFEVRLIDRNLYMIKFYAEHLPVRDAKGYWRGALRCNRPRVVQEFHSGVVMNRFLCHTGWTGSQGEGPSMRYLLFILFFLSGFTDGPFNSAWGGEIRGQVLRIISEGKVVPFANLDLSIVEDVPGIRECKITTETKSHVVTTDANGLFSIGALKAGQYHICAEYDYEADPDSGRRFTASIVTLVYVSRMGVTKVTIKK